MGVKSLSSFEQQAFLFFSFLWPLRAIVYYYIKVAGGENTWTDVGRRLLSILPFVFLSQEYVEQGPLLPQGVVVKPLSTEDARRTFVGCVRGLHYLHQHGVIHGDIKPQNLLVAADGNVKIADFGAAVVLQHEVILILSIF